MKRQWGWVSVGAAFVFAVACGQSHAPSESTRTTVEALAAGCDASRDVGFGIDDARVCLGEGYTALPKRHPDEMRIVRHRSGWAHLFAEHRASPEEAVGRLGEIEAEGAGDRQSSMDARFALVHGWPALLKTFDAPLSRPEEHHVDGVHEGPEAHEEADDSERGTYVVAALAYGPKLLRTSAFFVGDDARTNAEALLERVAQARGLKEGPAAASAAVIDRLEASARYAGQAFNSSPPPPSSPWTGVEPSLEPTLTSEGVNSIVNNVGGGFDSELDIAAAIDGRVVVVASNGQALTISNNGGASFVTQNFFPGAPFSGLTDGDPTLTVGKSGTFYYGFIGFPGQGVANLLPCKSNADPNCNTMSNELATASEATLAAGGGFTYLGPMDVSPQVSVPGGTPCYAPDQEHTAADRANASTTTAGADLLYTVYRRFVPTDNNGQCATTKTAAGKPVICNIVNCSGGGACACNAGDTCAQSCLPNISTTNLAEQSVTLTCSANSGASWPTSINLAAGSSYPRVAVGPSGAVYVVYRSGQNGAGSVVIDKYGSCDGRVVPAGLAGALRQFPGFPVTVSAQPNIAGGPGCPTTPISGIDRCNSGSELSSPVVAVDDRAVAGPANETVLVSFANSSAFNPNPNETVNVSVSVNGGGAFAAPTVVNGAGTGRRFMPWTCTTGGKAFVSWYDGRNATAGASSDLADYYGRGLTIGAGGALTLGTEVRLSQVSDPLCKVGWTTRNGGFTGTRCTACADNCPVQPQFAGQCWSPANTACDFDTCNAGAGQPGGCPCAAGAPAGTVICQAGGGGPKYGDYNANTCVAGRFYSTWASSTAPAGQGPATGIATFSACPPNPEISTVTFADTTPPVVVASTVPAAPPTLNGCGTVSLTTPTAYDICGDPAPTVAPVVNGSTVNLNTFVFGCGQTSVNWIASDISGNKSSATPATSTIVTVTDATAPTLAGPPTVSLVACQPTPQLITLPASSVPVVTDSCNAVTGAVTLTGTVTAVNGAATSIPLTRTAAGAYQATLPFGVLTVQWKATQAANCSGQSGTLMQTITLTAAPALYAHHTLHLNGLANVVTQSNTPANIDNDGTGLFNLTQLDLGASAGAVLSAPPVTLTGSTTTSVVSGGFVTSVLANTGPVSQFTNPVLPPFPPLNVTYPITLNEVTVLPFTTLALAPGSYDNVVVPPTGTLALSAGTYLFNTLNVAPAATIKIDNTLGPVNVDVAINIINLGIVSSNGPASQFVLGYTGILPVPLVTNFSGVVIAPLATLSLAQPIFGNYTGAYYAFDVNVAAGVKVTESPYLCTVP